MVKHAHFVIASLMIASSAGSARAHELWVQPIPSAASVAKLTFGDSPDASDAEEVAEIAHARVWSDGKPLEVKRLPNGLEVKLAGGRPSVLSAFADRGVIDHMGDSFVICLAAYSQSKSVESDNPSAFGLDQSQLRLLLTTGKGGVPVVRATWKGKPVPDLAVQVFRRPGESPTMVEMSGRGEMPCPISNGAPISLLAVLMDKTPGERDGKTYTHTRYKAALTIDADLTTGRVPASECVARVKEVHGGGGPWAVVGYRMGERALKDLHLPRHSFNLLVTHRCPAEVQYSCIADGIQAATGASPGKLNLKLEEAPVDRLSTVIQDRKSGRRLRFTLRPEFAKSIQDLPHERLGDEGQRVAGLADDAMFVESEEFDAK